MIIYFNGPPGCGKTYLAECLAIHIKPCKIQPLSEIAKACILPIMEKLTNQNLSRFLDKEYYEQHKDLPLPGADFTFRQSFIENSTANTQLIVNTLYNHLMDLMFESQTERNNLIIPDLGYERELKVLNLDTWTSTYVFNIRSEGCEWEDKGDTRIDLTQLIEAKGYRVFNIVNKKGSLSGLLEMIKVIKNGRD